MTHSTTLFQEPGEISARCRKLDWSQTGLGSLAQWPQSLRTATQMVLASPFPNIVLWGADLIQIYNDEYRFLMGSKHPAGLGQPTQQCWPEVWHINQPIYQRVWAGESVSFEDALYPITRSGQLEDAWFTLAYSPVRDESGQIGGILVTVFETTSRIREQKHHQQAEDALRHSEERLRHFVTASSDIVYRMSADWQQMAYLNGKEFLTDTQTINGSWLEQYIPLDDQEAVQRVIQAAIRQKSLFELEHRVIQADGRVGWTFSRAIPVLDEQGQIREWFGAASNITARKQGDADLRQSEERYRQLSAQLDEQVRQRTQELEILVQDLKRSNDNLHEFAYVASHDLQEPLRKIEQFGHLLQQQYGSSLGDGGQYLDRMQGAARRMSVLIKDLLNYSRIATGQMSSEAVNLSVIMDRVLIDLEIILDETTAQVRVDALPTVVGEPSQLGQLFSNLLSNALKFHKPGQPAQVWIRCQRLEAAELPPSIHPIRLADVYYCIEVADEGIGFDEKYTDRIFEVFQRLQGKNQYAGTGIGLAICQKVVANHGGAITAISQPDQGATFQLYLPI